MKIITAIFGDRYAEKYGKALLQYFESGDFPQELLQYPKLNLLYREFVYDKACRRGEAEGQELVDYLDAMLEERRGKLDGEGRGSGR